MDNHLRLIDEAWENRAALAPQEKGPLREAVDYFLKGLDEGTIRIAEKRDGAWQTNLAARKALVLAFRLRGAELTAGPQAAAFDKFPLKTKDWRTGDFLKAGFRAVPGALVRYSAYIAKDAVLMPCFVNAGAYVGEGTMIDTWSTVGSGAQVGRNCHISGGVGLGGVLEPLQQGPVVVEDNCFIGARSEIAEGVVVEKDAVLSMGVFIGASTKIIDRESGEVFTGRVPAGAVVVPGTLPGRPLPGGAPGPSLSCAVIVKRVDERTRAKTSPNTLLRELKL